MGGAVRMKKSRAITAGVIFLAALVLRFAFSGRNFIAYALILLSALIVVFGMVGKTVKRFIALILALGLVYFVIIEIPIIDEASGDGDFDADYLIVLGAAVHGDTPSLSLVERLEAAKDYLTKHPDTVAIVSGGQGGGENVSEAQAMYEWLCEKGIDLERIIMENKATSTYENLKFSREIINARSDNATIAVVSSEYHLCRAKLIAKTLDMYIHTVPAHTTYFSIKLNYFIREAFGVTYQLTFA